MKKPAVVIFLASLFFVLAFPVRAMVMDSSGYGPSVNQSTTTTDESSNTTRPNGAPPSTCTSIPFQQALAQPSLNFESTVNGSVVNILQSLAVNMGGPRDCALQQVYQANGWPTGGAIGSVGTGIASLINNKPVSTTEYIADLGSSLGLAKPAYAQNTGLGWQAMSPVLNLWKAFRNIAYLAFVIIFVIIGFMIMFRTKINPQTVISVQAAIPNLIITLILITFSYAIASLAIDLIYVLLYLIIGIFSLGGFIGDAGKTISMLTTKNIFQLALTDYGVFIGQPSNALGDIVSQILGGGNAAYNIDAGTSGTNILPGPNSTLGSMLTSFLGDAFSLIAYVVILFALLFTMFKLFFQLLIAYVSIVIAVIFAPFSILTNALPGSNGFMGWLKTILANTLVFPTVVFLFLLARILIGIHSTTILNDPASTIAGQENPIAGGESNDWGLSNDITLEQTAKPWMPPLLQVAGKADQVGYLLALGLLLLTPKAVQMVKDALKVEKGAGYGGYAMGQLLGVPGSVIGTPINTMSQAMQARYYIFGPKGQNPDDLYAFKGQTSAGPQ